jgi:hypothetical protein
MPANCLLLLLFFHTLQVTDSHDRVTLMTILSSFYNHQLVDAASYSLATTTTHGYTAPPHTDLKVGAYEAAFRAQQHIMVPLRNMCSCITITLDMCKNQDTEILFCNPAEREVQIRCADE